MRAPLVQGPSWALPYHSQVDDCFAGTARPLEGLMRSVPLLAVMALMGAAVANAGVFPYSYRVHTLGNGLKVILVPLPSDGLVAYYSVVRTGSRDEVEPGHSGFAHFFEHMMFRGTEKVPGPEYDRLMTSMGANANAYTNDDWTCYHINFATADLPRIIELEADRFQNLSYAEREFQTEAGAVYGELRKGKTSPMFVLFEALQNTAFDVHTYKHTTIGFEADVAAMPTMYDYSRSFYARFYRPENVVVMIAGDFDEAATLALVERHYGGWKPGYVAPQIPAEPAQTAGRHVDVSYEGRTLPTLTIAWKGERFDPASRDVAAASVLEDLLFGETSEAYRQLVLEQRVVQRLRADFSSGRDPGLWTVMATIGQEKDIDGVHAAIDAAVARFRQQPPDGDELESLKKRVRYQFLMSMDTPDNVAGGLARFAALTGGIEAVDTVFATIAALTPVDVQRTARAYLTDGRRTVAVLKGAGR
jgi:zinc protease